VEKGIITEKFGPQKHPVLANVIENNLGIEISTGENSRVRSIFNGVVVGIFAIPGENMSIIIQHGRYYSVYQNLVNISVRQGSQIEAKQEIGAVYSDSSESTPSVLKFMIFFEKEKLDPEMWIVKK
jgi:murein DD-endopeptidase MepM/ murein hydrolase activator NlpD